jgi:hypothetical protein
VKKFDLKKLASRGALLGFALAIACHFVPPDYRLACEAIVKVCTGGF